MSPPRAGKTILMQKMARAVLHNYPKAFVIMLLIDERPEEVTDMEREVPVLNAKSSAAPLMNPLLAISKSATWSWKKPSEWWNTESTSLSFWIRSHDWLARGTAKYRNLASCSPVVRCQRSAETESLLRIGSKGGRRGFADDCRDSVGRYGSKRMKSSLKNSKGRATSRSCSIVLLSTNAFGLRST